MFINNNDDGIFINNNDDVFQKTHTHKLKTYIYIIEIRMYKTR